MISAVSVGSFAFAPTSMLSGSRVSSVSMVALGEKAKDDSAFAYGLPGNIAPAGDFDPANLLEGTSKAEVYRWREVRTPDRNFGPAKLAGGAFITPLARRLAS